jgi:hypothetical protein
MVGHSGKHVHIKCKEISDETASSEKLEPLQNRDAAVIKEILQGVTLNVPQ